MSRNIEGFIFKKPSMTLNEVIGETGDKEYEIRERPDFCKMIRDSISKFRKKIKPETIFRAYMKVFYKAFMYLDTEVIKKLITSVKGVQKIKSTANDETEDEKEVKRFIRGLKSQIGNYESESDDSSSDDEPVKKKGEGLKRGPGRPKKIIMDSSSSSESDEESEKMGMGLKVKRGRPISIKGHKKCSCGSGLDVEPYKKFFEALKKNTTLK